MLNLIPSTDPVRTPLAFLFEEKTHSSYSSTVKDKATSEPIRYCTTLYMSLLHCVSVSTTVNKAYCCLKGMARKNFKHAVLFILLDLQGSVQM